MMGRRRGLRSRLGIKRKFIIIGGFSAIHTPKDSIRWRVF
jgi:hypothetical protein